MVCNHPHAAFSKLAVSMLPSGTLLHPVIEVSIVIMPCWTELFTFLDLIEV